MDGLIWLLVALVVLGAGIVVVKSLSSRGSSEQINGGRLSGLPFQRRQQFLTPAERSFYGVLSGLAATRGWSIFAKVRLEDLIEVQKGTDKLQAHRNRIKSRHIDFLVCDAQTVAPLLAIELNDSSHSREARQERDAFVSGALNAAGLPLAEVSAKRAYSVPELAEIIDAKLGVIPAPASIDTQPSAAAVTPAQAQATLSCPRCGSPLVERYSKKSDERFLGCSTYPACRHTQPLPALEAQGTA